MSKDRRISSTDSLKSACAAIKCRSHRGEQRQSGNRTGIAPTQVADYDGDFLQEGGHPGDASQRSQDARGCCEREGEVTMMLRLRAISGDGSATGELFTETAHRLVRYGCTEAQAYQLARVCTLATDATD